jgi:hypothetical protein
LGSGALYQHSRRNAVYAAARTVRDIDDRRSGILQVARAVEFSRIWVNPCCGTAVYLPFTLVELLE